MIKVVAVLLTLTACGSTPAMPNAEVTVPACVLIDGKADARCDPGALNPSVTPETLKSTVCKPGWAASVRPRSSITARLEAIDMQRYGLTDGPANYRYDHLVPISIGGALADSRNLWPQPVVASKVKDREEDRLHNQVCSGALSLAEAQQRMIREWTH